MYSSARQKIIIHFSFLASESWNILQKNLYIASVESLQTTQLSTWNFREKQEVPYSRPDIIRQLDAIPCTKTYNLAVKKRRSTPSIYNIIIQYFLGNNGQSVAINLLYIFYVTFSVGFFPGTFTEDLSIIFLICYCCIMRKVKVVFF